MKRTYRVQGGNRKHYEDLADARKEAEKLMAGRHDDDSVLIEAQDEDEDFFEPYAHIVRENGKFVLKR